MRLDGQSASKASLANLLHPIFSSQQLLTVVSLAKSPSSNFFPNLLQIGWLGYSKTTRLGAKKKKARLQKSKKLQRRLIAKRVANQTLAISGYHREWALPLRIYQHKNTSEPGGMLRGKPSSDLARIPLAAASRVHG